MMSRHSLEVVLVGDPPATAPDHWIAAVANRLVEDYPGFSYNNARACARLAFRAMWLLEAEEAAQLYVAIVEAEYSDRSSVRLLPRRLLD